jgi:signal peptidase II
VRDYLTLVGIAGTVVALDQGAKYLVRSNLEVGESVSPVAFLAPILRIVNWNNTGAAFGLFPSGGTVFTIVAVVVSLAILYYFPFVPREQIALRLGLALQLGGAMGNLTDRLIHGTVTDFISVGSFPVFNVADASISVGTAVLLGAMWIEERRTRREKESEIPSPGITREESTSEPDRPIG